MQNELFINGRRIDMGPDTVVGLTLQANDLGDINDRNANFSNVFKLPMTEQNRIEFENAENLNSGTNIPYSEMVSDYYEKGIPILQDGKATLVSTDENYNVRLNSGNSDFFGLIGDETVSELFNDGTSLGEFHQMDIATMVASNDLSKHYIYPLVDFLADPLGLSMVSTVSVNVTRMRTCTRIQTVFELIAEKHGFTLSGSFIDSEIYPKLFLTPDSFDYSEELLFLIQSNIAFYAERLIPGPEQVGVIPQAATGDSETFFRFAGSGTTDLTLTVDGDVFYPTIRGTIRLVYNFDAYISKPNTIFNPDRRKGIGVSIVDVTLGVELVNDILASESVNIDYWSYLADGVLTYTGDIISGHIYQAFVRWEIQEVDNAAFDYGFTQPGVFEMDFVASANAGYGNLVFMNQIFNIKQKDLISDVMKQCGILVQTNNVTKNVRFDYFDDVKKNIPLARDWSSKVDINQMPLSFQFGKYAKRNFFKYKEQSTVESGYGDGWFDIEDENLENEVTAVQLVTSATDQGGIDALVPTIRAITPTGSFTNPNNRILILERTTYDTNFETYDDQNGTVVTGIVPSMFARFDLGIIPTPSITESLTFRKNNLFPSLLDNYYPTLEEVLNRCKSVTLFLFLNANDVKDFDFTIPTYIDVQQKKVFMQGYFYVNQIFQYKGGLTKVTLLRL